MGAAEGPLPLVLASDVLVAATSYSSATWSTWPATPPGSRNGPADCLGIIAEPSEWALWLSDDLLLAVVRTLLETSALGWATAEVRRYVRALEEMARSSGGGVVTHVQPAVGEQAPLPLRAALDLAALVDAPVIVSDWSGLLTLSPWRSPHGADIFLLPSRGFQRRVDAARRAARE